MPRGVSLAIVVAVALPWALGLSLVGLWLLTSGREVWPRAGVAAGFAGMTLVAAGQLVFLVFVADRLYPTAARRVAPWVEVPLSLLVMVGCVLMVAAGVTAVVAGGWS